MNYLKIVPQLYQFNQLELTEIGFLILKMEYFFPDPDATGIVSTIKEGSEPYFTFIKYAGRKGTKKMININTLENRPEATNSQKGEIFIDSTNNLIYRLDETNGTKSWVNIGGSGSGSGAGVSGIFTQTADNKAYYRDGNIGVGTANPTKPFTIDGELLVKTNSIKQISVGYQYGLLLTTEGKLYEFGKKTNPDYLVQV